MWIYVEVDKVTSIIDSIETDPLKYKILTHDGDAGQVKRNRKKFSMIQARLKNYTY